MLLEKQLVIKRSTLPGVGKGLFTRKFIPKGTRIVEYKGRIDTWKNIVRKNVDSRYVFYIDRDHVIDADTYKHALARYANDAAGMKKTKELRNNSNYVVEKFKVYIDAIKNIPAGAEIFVGYGSEYWKAIKHNASLLS